MNGATHAQIPLKLYGADALTRARRVLEAAVQSAVAKLLHSALTVTVRGLEYMNDDPTAVDVLYAQLHAPRLQELVDDIAAAFRLAGLDAPAPDRVKLHATVLNSKRRRSMRRADGPR